MVVLIWTYYSSLILFFGAELIRAYAKRYDPEPIVPTEEAVDLTNVELAKQGMPSQADLDRAAEEETATTRSNRSPTI